MNRCAISLIVFSLIASSSAMAVETGATQIGRTVTTPNGATSLSMVDPHQAALDQAQAQVWGLTVQEVQLARQLSQPGSPRATFSTPNISPVEVLGIHATSAAERQRYATLFAKALRADTERVLAWTVTYGAVAKRLYPNEKIFDFGNTRVPKNQEIYLR